MDWDAAGGPTRFILRTQTRLMHGFPRTAPPAILSCVPRIPLSGDLMEAVSHRCEQDVRSRFRVAAETGSISFSLSPGRRLSRAIIKCALQELFCSRKPQVAFPLILVGPRFKVFDTKTSGRNARLPTACRLRGARDSLAHLLRQAGASASHCPGSNNRIPC